VLRGVTPLAVDDRTDIEVQLQAADLYLKASGLAAVGDPVVVAAAIPLGTGKETNTVRLHRVRA
jgi:pyruvate kinase